MHTFILGNLWETTAQVHYPRQSRVGEAGTASVEINRGWAIYKAIKVTESLQSPLDHKELAGDGQQLKRGTIRSSGVSQQGQGVSKTVWWASELRSRYPLWFSDSWLRTLELTRTSYSSLIVPTQQYYTKEEVLVFTQILFQHGIWTWAQGNAVYIAYKSEAQWISMSWNPPFPKDSEKGSQDGHSYRSSSTKAMTWHHWSYIS